MRVLLALALCASFSYAQTPPFTASGRYILGSDSVKMFFVADAGWSLMVQPTYTEAVSYLTDRANRGFNAIMVNLIDHKFGVNAPNNIYNVAPFTGAAFTTMNEPYFLHCDSVIQKAADLGIAVILNPTYTGYLCSDEGWCAEMQATSLADMKAWGVYVGNRYKNFSNIIWVIGADQNPATYSLTAKLDTVVAGIKQADTVYSRVFTAHGNRGLLASAYFPRTWLTLNNTYSDTTDIVALAGSAYDNGKPFLLLEGFYEGEHSMTQRMLRSQNYRTVLRGGLGAIFGNCPLWHFGYSASWCGSTDWVAALDDEGSTSMTYFGRMFNGRSWWKLIPDRDSSVMTAGSLSTWQFATTARASDSSCIIAYLPTNREITVNLNYLKTNSTIRAYWYDPITGVYSDLGTYARGSQSFTPTGSQDWVFLAEVSTYRGGIITRRP